MKLGGDTLSYCSSYSHLICENSWMIDHFPLLFGSGDQLELNAFFSLFFLQRDIPFFFDNFFGGTVICGVNSGGE